MYIPFVYFDLIITLEVDTYNKKRGRWEKEEEVLKIMKIVAKWRLYTTYTRSRSRLKEVNHAAKETELTCSVLKHKHT